MKNPEDWGWKRTKAGLTPVRTTKNPTPEVLLKFLSCQCKKGCGMVCGCRKAVICIHCNGSSCEHVPEILDDFDDGESEEEISEPGQSRRTRRKTRTNENLEMTGEGSKRASR